MIRLTRGNLLVADVEALVNTVNTVGVMGKGIALMFKEAFRDNYREYAAACQAGKVKVGTIFVTERPQASFAGGPRWILNFPTKQDWRKRSRIEWVELGLRDLRRVIREHQIRSVAIPPLGCGNGGLQWSRVRPLIERALCDLVEVDVVVYEPSSEHSSSPKRKGVQKLTPARALIADLVRRYWVLGIECSLLEVQKLAYFLDRCIRSMELQDPLGLRFMANRYGPYADSLRHLLNALDGSYLHCHRRINDASPTETIWFDEGMRERVSAYLGSECRQYLPALEKTCEMIDGFESPLGMELLATVDWLLEHERCQPVVSAVREGLAHWPDRAGRRKLRLFDDRLIAIALRRLA